ncbi:MAG: hypothetical protein ACFE9S_05370 [Candidatus Hermodarchaeota archaeon]
MASNTEKRTFFEYLDIIVVVLNSIVLVFSIFIIQSNAVLIFINLIFTVILWGLLIFTFLKKNPYYITPVYGMILFGVVFAFGLLTLPEFYNSLLWVVFLLIGILDVIFVAFMIKGSGSSASRVATAGGRVWTLVEPGSDTPSYIRGGRVNRKQKKAIQKQYHMSWIVLISVVSLLTIFLTFIL